MDYVTERMDEARKSVHRDLVVTHEDQNRLAEAVLHRVRTESRRLRARKWKVAIPTVVAAVVLVAGGVGLQKAGYLETSKEGTPADSPQNFSPDRPEPLSEERPLVAPSLNPNQMVEHMVVYYPDRTVLDYYHNIATGQAVNTLQHPDGSKQVTYENVRELGSYILNYNSQNRVQDRVYHKHPPIADAYISQIKETQDEFKKSLQDQKDVQKKVIGGLNLLVVTQKLAPKDGRSRVETVYYDEATSLKLRREVYTDEVLDEVQSFTYTTMDEKDLAPKFFEIPKGTYRDEETNKTVAK